MYKYTEFRSLLHKGMVEKYLSAIYTHISIYNILGYYIDRVGSSIIHIIFAYIKGLLKRQMDIIRLSFSPNVEACAYSSYANP